MSAKKKICIISVTLAILAALVFSGLFLFSNTFDSGEISKEQAQTLVNEALDSAAASDITRIIAEKNTITVNNLSYGKEKNIILDCSLETVDVHGAVSPHYDKFLGVYAFKETGMYKSKTNIAQEFAAPLTEIINTSAPVKKDCVIEIFITSSGHKVYLQKDTVNLFFGNIDLIDKEVSPRKFYTDEEGNEQEIVSTNVTKGFVECFKLNYDDQKPDTGNWITRKWNSFKNDFNRIFIKHARWKSILAGLWTTLKLTFFSLIIGIILGFVVAFIRCTSIKLKKKNFIISFLDAICKLYITIIRGTPAMVQIMIIYFVLFMPLGVSKFIAAVVCFGINSGAYVAEIVRGGIMSVDEGQTEAGRSLGFGYMATMFYIILPQAFKAVLPALANEFIVLLKETSIAFYIGLGDLMYSVNAIRAATYTQFMPLIAAALIYLVMVLVLSKLVNILERRLRNNER